MSSLKNKLIRLAYENPHLRGDLLPLIIKKYANVGPEPFSSVAQSIYNERSFSVIDTEKEIEDKNKIAVDLANLVNKALAAFVQQNLRNPEVFPEDNISVNLEGRGTQQAFIYTNIDDNGKLIITDTQENTEQETMEVIPYNIPKGLSGNFFIKVNLSQFKEEEAQILEKYMTPKLSKDSQGNEVQELAQSSITVPQARKKYVKALQDSALDLKNSLADPIKEKVDAQKKFFDEKLSIWVNKAPGGAGARIPPSVKDIVTPNVKLDCNFSVNEIHFTMSPKLEALMQCQISLGGSVKWGVTIKGNPSPATVASQPQSNPMGQDSLPGSGAEI